MFETTKHRCLSNRPRAMSVPTLRTANRPRTGCGRLLTLGFALLVVGTAACHANTDGGSQAESATPAAASPSAAAPAHDAKLALSYEPGDTMTDRLIAAAQTRATQTPDQAEVWVNLAALLLRRKRETADASMMLYAEDALRVAQSHGADNPRVVLLMAMVSLERHEFEHAKRLASRLIQLDPDDSTGHLLLGDALLEMGSYEQSIDAYQRAVDLRPDLRSYNRGAHMRWLHGDFEGALELVELALDAGSSRDPESSAWCYVDLGGMYWHRGAGRQAVASADRALQLVPQYVPALVLKARALESMGQRTEAITLLEQATARRPNVEDLLLLVELLEHEGRTERANVVLADAEQLAGEDPRPLAIYYARRAERPERALALAEQELQARRNIEAHDAHALALLRNGRVADAKIAMEAALKLETPDARLHLHAGLIELADGNETEAGKRLDQALALNPHADPRLADELRRGIGNDRSL